MSATIYEAPRAAAKPGETIVTSTCAHNCGGRCVVNAHVRDGRIVHISTDVRRWNAGHPPLSACAPGVVSIKEGGVACSRIGWRRYPRMRERADDRPRGTVRRDNL